MKVVLSPWFYGSCVRYFKEPKIYQPDDLKLLYEKLEEAEPKKVIYVQDSLLQHEELSKLYAENRMDEYLSMYKSLVLDILQKFQPCQTLLELQFNYVIQLLYNINACITSRQFTKAFEICFTAQSVFTEHRLTLPRAEALAFEAQFYNLYSAVYYKEGKAEAALAFAEQALEADGELLVCESVDGEISSLLNVAFLLEHLYRASEAEDCVKKALLNVDNSFDTQFSYLFEPRLNKQRIGIAKAISMHLNGMVQILSKDSETPTSIWYEPFDLTLQIAIQYFARLDDIDNCWNNQIIAWALIDLEIVEELAKKNDPYFVGSLQMGRYENIKYYLFEGNDDKSEQLPNKYNKESEFLDEMVNKKARGLTKVKSMASSRSLSRKLSQKKGNKQGVIKKKKEVTIKNYQVTILPRSKSAELLHNYNEHYTQNNTEELSQRYFFDNMGDVRLKYDKANRIPEVLKEKLGLKKTPLQRSYSPILRSDCVPKSITTISFLINYKYEALVDPFPMCLYDLNDVMRYHSNKKNARDYLPIDYQDNFSLFPNLKYFQGAVKLDPSKYSNAELETLAATKIETCFRHILQQRKQMINNTNEANLTVLGYCVGFLVRNKVRREKQAILTIQSYIRVYYAVELRNRSRESALLIERLSRGNFIREEFLNYLYYVYRIQRIFKYFLAKKYYQETKIAALVIERNYNAYKVRKQHKLELKDELIIIERIVRVIQAEKELDEKKNALLLLQKQIRMFKQRSEYRSIYEAAVTIQTIYFMLSRQKEYNSIRYNAITIECLIKYKNKCIARKQANDAATTIEIFAKYYLKKESIYKIYPRHNLELIKSYVKYEIERNRHKRNIRNAIIMEEYIRMFLAKLHYAQKLNSLMIIQKYCRKEIEILECKDARYNRKNKALLIAENKAFEHTPEIEELLHHKIREAQLNYTMAVNVKPKLFGLEKNKYLEYNSYFRPPVTCFPFKIDEVPLYECAEYYEPAGSSFVVRRAIPENPYCETINQIDIAKKYEEVRPRRLFEKLRKPITYVRVDAKFYSCTDLHNLARNELKLEDMGIAMIRENIVRRGLASEEECNEVEKLLEREAEGKLFLRESGENERDGVIETTEQDLTINPFKFKINCLVFNYEYDLRDRLHIGRYVILIEKFGRMRLARKSFLDLRSKTITIEKISRLISVETRTEEWKNAVDVIQYFYRTNLISAIKNRELECYSLTPNLRRILKIEKQIRYYEASKYLERVISSAITIEIEIRLYVVRKEEKTLLNNTLRLEELLHPIANKIRYSNYVENIILIQKRFKKCKESIIEKRIMYLEYHYKIVENKPFNYVKEAIELERCLRAVMVEQQMNREFSAVMEIEMFLKARKEYLIKEAKIKAITMIERLYRQNMKSEVQKFRLDVEKLESIARSYLLHTEWERKIEAVIKIEAYFKGALQMRSARKIYVAVRRIQLHSRKIQARIKIRQSFDACIVIQKYFRGVVTRHHLIEYIKGLTVLEEKLEQTRYNSYWARKVRYTVESRKEQIMATLTIQAFISGRKGRAEMSTEHCAIVTIEREAHIFIWRCRFFYIKVAVEIIQRRYRERRYRLSSKMKEAEMQMLRDKKACTIIERFWRGYNIRKIAAGRLEVIEGLEDNLKEKLVHVWYKEKIRAAIHIQRCFKRRWFEKYGGYLDGNGLVKDQEVRALKTFAEEHGIHVQPNNITSKALGSFMVVSVCFIQENVRGFLHRKHVKNIIQSVINIEAVIRGINARNYVNSIRDKANVPKAEIIKARLNRLKSREEQKENQTD